MSKPTKEEERENKGTVRLTSSNWDYVWEEVAVRRKDREPNATFNGVVNDCLKLVKDKYSRPKLGEYY